MKTMREWAILLSGILGFIIPGYFGWTVYEENIPQNIATWGMVLLLDALGLVLAYKDGNKKPYMQIGWTMAATIIFLAVIFNGHPWQWGRMETISLALCVLAIYLWLTKSARFGLWAYMVAMYIAFFPQAVEFWRTPQPDTLWLWLWTIATCLLAIYGAPKRDFANTFVPWAAVILNMAIALLCLPR